MRLKTNSIKLNLDTESSCTELQRIFELLIKSSGHDFTNYKKKTIYRRIERRLNFLNINNLDSYVNYLQINPLEVHLLFKEILIGVTNFFRDNNAFTFLREKLLYDLLKDKEENEVVRVWIPGCSTGEEAYSISIILIECMEDLNKQFIFQIFATDIDETTICIARKGIYKKNIIKNVSSKRLQRFFSYNNGIYTVSKQIRDMIVFAPQNIIKDPPFTKLDLLCCRNLMIYFDLVLQEKLLPLFHYSLKPEGYLFLGSSETIGSFINYFRLIDNKSKIYQKKGNELSITNMEFPIMTTPKNDSKLETKTTDIINTSVVEKILLDNIIHPTILINEKGDISYIHGRTGDFFELPTGVIRKYNIFEITRSELKLELYSAVRKVVTHKKTFTHKDLTIDVNGKSKSINLIVKPVKEPVSMKGMLIVVLEDIPYSNPVIAVVKKVQVSDISSNSVEDIKQELQYTKESLQTTVEEMESANEELKSTNEELQSTNEELQSTNEELQSANEELETSKEEQQALNEGLTDAQQELENSRNKYFDLYELAPVGYITLTKDRLIENINLTCADLMGTDQNKLLGKKFNKYVAPSYRNKVNYYFKKCFQTRLPQVCEIQIKKRNVYSWVKLESLVTESGNMVENLRVAISDISDKKIAEEEILNLAKFPAENPSPVIRISKNKTVLYANNAALEIIENDQLKIGHIVNKRWHSVIDEVLAMGTFNRDFETKESDKFILWMIVPFCNEGYVNFYGKDISVRKRSEQIIINERYRLFKAEEIAHVGSWELQIRTNELKWTEETYRIFSTPFDSNLTYKYFVNCIHYEDREKLEKKIFSTIKGNGSCDFEVKILVDNEIKWIRVIGELVLNQNSDPYKIIGAISDITDTKTAAEELLALEIKFESLVKNVPDVMYSAKSDKTGTILYISDRWEEWTGYTPRDCYNNHEIWPFSIHPDDREKTANTYLEAIRTNTDNISEYRLVHKDTGQVRWVWNHGIPVFDKDGNIDKYDGIVRNITERKKLENSLNKAQKLDAVGKLAGGFAHEFNNLLTVIMGNIELTALSIQNKVDPDDQVLSFIDNSLKETKQAAELVKKLLMFSRKSVVMLDTINLNNVIESVQSMLIHLVTEKITLTFKLAPDLKYINADSGQLEQIIINLVLNAKDAMPKGGELIFETSNISFEEEFIFSYLSLKPGNYIMLSVQDNGIGMDSQVLEQIFEPFYTTKDVGKGTGLGLSVVYGVLKQYGGCIVPTSKPGKGTTFKVYIPAVDTDIIPIETVSFERDCEFKGNETILVCDDNKGILDLTVDSLRNAGYNVLSALNGKDAINLIDDYHEDIHLLVTDVVMPGMNGKELSEFLTAKYKNLKTIFVSGYPSEVIAFHGVLNDEMELLNKPFTPADLLKSIHSCLNKNR